MFFLLQYMKAERNRFLDSRCPGDGRSDSHFPDRIKGLCSQDNTEGRGRGRNWGQAYLTSNLTAPGCHLLPTNHFLHFQDPSDAFCCSDLRAEQQKKERSPCCLRRHQQKQSQSLPLDQSRGVVLTGERTPNMKKTVVCTRGCSQGRN